MSLALKGQICLSIFWQQGVSHGLGIVYPILSKVSYNLAASSIVWQTHTNQILHNDLIDLWRILQFWASTCGTPKFEPPTKHPTSWVTDWLITIGFHIPKSRFWLREGSKKQRFSATLRVQNLRIFPKISDEQGSWQRLVIYNTSRTERMCSESRFLSLLWLQVRLGRKSSNSICVLFKSKGCKGGPLRVLVICS